MSVAEGLDSPGEERPLGNAEIFRAVNDRILELEGEWLVRQYDFMCECDDATCTRVLHMTGEQYRALRADPACFAVLPGHEQSGDEVLRRGDGLIVVRKGTVGGQRRARSESDSEDDRR